MSSDSNHKTAVGKIFLVVGLRDTKLFDENGDIHRYKMHVCGMFTGESARTGAVYTLGTHIFSEEAA